MDTNTAAIMMRGLLDNAGHDLVIRDTSPSFIEIIDILHEKHLDILDAQLSEEDVELNDGTQTPRDYIRSHTPKVFAHIQSKEISELTTPGQKNTRGMRL